MSLEKFRELNKEGVLPTTTLDTIESWKKRLVDELGWSQEDVEEMRTGELYIIDRDSIRKDGVEIHFGLSEEDNLNDKLPVGNTDATDEDNMQVDVVESADDIKAPEYTDDTAENPTASAEALPVDENRISDEMFAQMLERVEDYYTEVAELKGKTKEEIDTAMFDFSEVDYLYNIGITDEEKKAYVVYLQNLIGRKIEGGFNQYYPMPLVNASETEKGYVLGQQLEAGTQQAKEFILLLKTLIDDTSETGSEIPFEELPPRDLFKLFFSLSSLQPATIRPMTPYPYLDDLFGETGSEISLNYKTDENFPFSYYLVSGQQGNSNTPMVFSPYYKRTTPYDNEYFSKGEWIKFADNGRPIKQYKEKGITTGYDYALPSEVRSKTIGKHPNIYADGDKVLIDFNSVDALGGLILWLVAYRYSEQLTRKKRKELASRYYDFAGQMFKDKDDGGIPAVFLLINPVFLKDIGKDEEKEIKTNIGTITLNGKQAETIKELQGELFDIQNVETLTAQKKRYGRDSDNSPKNEEIMLDFLEEALLQDEDTLGQYTKGQEGLPPEVMALIKSGDLFYDGSSPTNEQYQPKWKYQSGDVFGKYAWFYNNSAIIEDKFGATALEKHKEAIEFAWNKLRERWLTCNDKDRNRRLTLVPISKIATNFKINEYIEPRNKNTITKDETYIGSKDNTSYEDIYKYVSLDKNRGEITEYTLKRAFVMWLKRAGYKEEALNYGIEYSDGVDGWEDISRKYLDNKRKPSGVDEDVWLIEKDLAKQDGERLFSQFLATGLTPNDQRRLEILWNRKFNGIVEPNLNKVPIGFSYKKFFGEKGLNDLRKEKLEAIRFYMSRGSCCLAYGVGIGKTWCSNFILAQMLDLGLTKRPLIAVPNQVYAQFGLELQKVLGTKKEVGNDLLVGNYYYNPVYNISEEMRELALSSRLADGTITICTYEGLDKIGLKPNSKIVDDTDDFNEAVISTFKMKESENIATPFEIEQILGDEDKKLKHLFGLRNEAEDLKQYELQKKTSGKAKRPPANKSVFLNEIGFDYITIDEAHNFKKLFTTTKGRADEYGDRKENPYAKIGSVSRGIGSKRAEQLAFLVRYIQQTNPFGNTLLLTATPFTNSPLEVWTMLCLINYDLLKSKELTQTIEFFDAYAKTKMEWQITASLQYALKDALVGWTNTMSLQQFVFHLIDKKGKKEEDLLVERPNKIVLPLKSVLVDKKFQEVAEKDRIYTTLKFSPEQAGLMNRIREYSGGKMDYEELCSEEYRNTTEYGKYPVKKGGDSGRSIVNIEKASKKDEDNEFASKNATSTRLLTGLTYSRQLALSPYFYKCSGKKGKPTAKQLVEESPKLHYIMECIKSVKEYHEAKGTSISGQVLFMDVGVKAFPKLQEYLVDEVGFDIDEIGMITGSDSTTKIGKKSMPKSEVANAFNGFVLDENGNKLYYEETKGYSDKDRVKVLLGSSSIREGINLQERASVLYNAYVDYNPTDNIQLEGRIWRQGNIYQNVRIVFPLVENSADVFMYQKLGEKSKRINEIWNKDGQTNEIEIEQVNPEDVKYDLITDCDMLARIKVEDLKRKLDLAKTKINRERVALQDLTPIFKEYSEVYGLNDLEGRVQYLTQTTIVGSYFFLCTLRDDLLTKPLLDEKKKDIFLDLIDKVKNEDNLVEKEKIDKQILECFNYTTDEMIGLMKQFVADSKIVYPLNYTSDFAELSADAIEEQMPIMLGDEVRYKKRRRDEDLIGAEVVEVFNVYDNIIDEDFYKTFDFPAKTLKEYYQNTIKGNTGVNDNLIPKYVLLDNDDEVDIGDKELQKFIKPKKSTKKATKKDEREYLNWGTKKFKEELVKISFYQRLHTIQFNGNYYRTDNRYVRIDDEFVKVATMPPTELYTGGYYETSDTNTSFYYLMDDRCVPDNTTTREDGKIVPNYAELSTDIKDAIEKDYSIEDRFKETWTKRLENVFINKLFYKLNYPKLIKTIQKDIDTKLRPKGIDTKEKLFEEINKKREDFNKLQQEKNNLTSPERLEELARKECKEREDKLTGGVRTPADVMTRAREFAQLRKSDSGDVIYLGNEMLDIFTEKETEKREQRQVGSKRDEIVYLKEKIESFEALKMIATTKKEKEYLTEKVDSYNGLLMLAEMD